MKEFNLYSISRGFIQNKKSYFLFISGIMIASIVLTLVITSMFNTLIFKIDDGNAKKYGLQHASVFNIAADEKEAITKSEMLKSWGSIFNYGYHKVVDSEVYITLGYFDNQAILLGNLHILEGKLPETNNEAAIERHVAERLGNIGVGSTISIDYNGRPINIIVTGILYDFSGTWNVPEEVLRGKTDVPQVLVGGQEGFTQESQTCLVELPIYDEQKIFDLFSKYNLDKYFSVLNSKYYESGKNELAALNLFRNLFITALVLIIQVIIYYSLHQFTTEIRDSYKVLRILGFTYGQIFKIYFIHISIITACSLFAGVIVGVPIAILLGTLQGLNAVSVIFRGAFLYCIVSICLDLLMAAVIFQNNIVKFCRASLVHQAENNIKSMQIGKRFSTTLTNYNFQLHVKKIWPLLAAFGIIFLLIGVVNTYFNGYYTNSTIEVPDFIMQTNSIEVYKEYGPYRLYKSGNAVFEADDVETALANEKIDFSYCEILTNGAVILSDSKNDGYWAQWISVYDSQDPDTINYPKAIPQNITASNDYSVLLSSPMLIDWINTNYFDGEEIVGRDSTVLFLPNHYIDDIKVEHLRFAQLYIDEGTPLENAIDNMDYIKCQTDELEIDIQISEPLFIDKGNGKIHIEKPTIIIPETRLESFSLFTGISQVVIYMTNDTTEEQLEQFDEELRVVTHNFPNSYFFSLYEIEQRENQQSLVIHVTLGLLSFILILFLFVAFYQAMYLVFYKRRLTFSIYRAIGMDFKSIYKIVSDELKRYAFICIGIFCWLLFIQYLLIGNLQIFISGMIFLGVAFIALIYAGYYAAKKISGLFREENLHNLLQYKE